MLTSELIPDRFEYRQGATYVYSRIVDLFEAGAGKKAIGEASVSGRIPDVRSSRRTLTDD